MQRNGFGLNATFVTAAGAGIMDVMLPISGERKSYVLDLLADCRTVRDRVGKRPQIHLRIHSGMAERDRLRHSNQAGFRLAQFRARAEAAEAVDNSKEQELVVGSG